MKELLQTLTDRYPALLSCRKDIEASAQRIGAILDAIKE